MSITTYPLNGPLYDAKDAAGYTATRTSGVYSADTDFAVSPAGGTSVTVSAGQGWVSPARFEGYSVIMREAETLTLPLADGQRPRIDRIVLRYDAAARKTSLLTLQGTPDSQPVAPGITRTALTYDLCLAEITRPAASDTITSANIRDTRLREDLCGVMRDGVTGIPTATLEAEARERLNAAVESYTGGFVARDSVLLRASDWTDTGSGTYPWICDAPIAVCNAALTPMASVSQSSSLAATAAGLAPSCETRSGAVRFTATRKPTEDITMQVLLFGPNASDRGNGEDVGLTVVDGQVCITYDTED